VSEPGLVVNALQARAGSFALGPIELHLQPGRVLVLVGPSGAGKTTTLETLAGFRTPLSGRIALAGRDITTLAPEDRRIGYVFQHAHLFPHLSVRDNVAFGINARGREKAGQEMEWLSRFGAAHLADRQPGALSGGERQRVALARALASQPRLLLLDEPLSAVDPPQRETLRELLQDLMATLDIPAVHVTQDRDEALALADDLAVVVNGQLRQTGAAAQVASQPMDADVAALFGWLPLQDSHVTAGYYRPEDVELSQPGTETQSAAPADLRFTARVERLLPTLPLARVTIGPSPQLTALVLRRRLDELGLRRGAPVQVEIPRGQLRRIPAAGATSTPTS
jgi:ABC-type Fe3+/spermidine/putrescine transport system ATPase subunit